MQMKEKRNINIIENESKDLINIKDRQLVKLHNAINWLVKMIPYGIKSPPVIGVGSTQSWNDKFIESTKRKIINYQMKRLCVIMNEEQKCLENQWSDVYWMLEVLIWRGNKWKDK
jgi:hypothetical protein